MSESILPDYCLNLKYIPQISGTCWFNSILNVMLYSTGMRRVLQKYFNKNSKVIERNKNDKLLTFLLFMLQNYNNIHKLEKIYKSFKHFRLKPEYLLLSYLNEYDLNTKRYIISKTKDKYNSFGYNTIYIAHILKTYNIPYINIIKSKSNSYYLNLKKHSRVENILKFMDDIIEENSDHKYLDDKLKNSDIIFISSGTDMIYNFTNITEYNNLDKYFTSSENTNLHKFKRDVKELNEFINIKGYTYKLDSCLISNNDNSVVSTLQKKIYHAISGITCNNKKYAIDSRSKFILKNKAIDINLNYEIDDNLKFNNIDWVKIFKDDNQLFVDDLKNTISKHYKSSLTLMSDVLNANKLLYDKNDNIIYIYIKVDDSLKSADIKIPQSDSKDIKVSISTKSLIFEKELLSKYNKDIYNLDDLPIFELAKIIKDITKEPEVSVDINNYRYIYNFYNNSNMIFEPNIDKNNKNEMLKNLFIIIIKNYFYYGIKINLNRYLDKNIFTGIIKHYISTTTNYDNLLKENNIPVRYDYIISHLDEIKDLLFKTKYNFFYDKYIEELISEKYIINRIIIKLLIHNFLYQEILQI